MMAESDAAGPGTPGGPKSRAITREDVDRLLAQAEREWESLTPEERARREAEAEKADREAYEAALKAARPTIEALERAAKSAERSAAGLVWPKPATYWEEAPEIGPAAPIDQSVFASLMEGIEPARPLSTEEIRAAVADGVRDAMTEAARKPAPDSAPPAAPQSGMFTGSVVGSLPIVHAVREIARVLNTAEQQAAETVPETQRPAFEVDPPEVLLNALREAFPGFKPTDRWWIHVEHELKTSHHRSSPAAHDAFCAAFGKWSAADLIHHLEDEGRVGRPAADPPAAKGRRPRKRTVDGLDVNQWVAAMAAADPSFRHLSEKSAEKLGPFRARTIGTCELWIQMKAGLKAEAAEKAEQAQAELEDRLGEEGLGGFRQSSTKHGTGFQRRTREDLKHERDVEDFLRSKAGQPRKKRAK